MLGIESLRRRCWRSDFLFVLPAAGTETMDLVYRVGFAPNDTLTAVC
jgi:hypothetical protein